DHRSPPHRLDDEQAKHAVDEVEGARDFLRREALAQQLGKQRGLLRQLGEQIGRKADQAAPDDPADALIVARREIATASEEDSDRRDADRKADEERASRPDFGGMAEHASHARKRNRKE